MGDSPWDAEFRNDHSLTVTIKYGKGYEESWVVFKGASTEDVREQVIAYFGLDGASVAELTMSDLVVNVTNLAHGKGNAAAMLGATVIKTEKTKQVKEEKADDPWADEEEAEGPSPILARIESCQSVDELKKLWAENQSEFADAAVMDAWKARGKALSAA